MTETFYKTLCVKKILVTVLVICYFDSVCKHIYDHCDMSQCGLFVILTIINKGINNILVKKS